MTLDWRLEKNLVLWYLNIEPTHSSDRTCEGRWTLDPAGASPELY